VSLRWLLALLLCAAPALGCGSSSSTTSSIASPSPVRCTVDLAQPPRMDHDGGSGRLSIATNRECTWTAKAEVSWITVSPGSGQGEAQLTYRVAANSSSSERKGRITVNEKRVELTQAGAPCRYGISPAQLLVDAIGGQQTVAVSAQSGCRWTAESQAPWITVASGQSGTGGGQVALAIAPNDGPQRTGAVRIAGQTLTVTQAAAGLPPPPACTITIADATRDFDEDGGDGTVTVRADNTCAWTASSPAPWLAITAGSPGTGNGTVRFRVEPNTSESPRSTTIAIGDARVDVSQAGAEPCDYRLSRSSFSVDAAGGGEQVEVDADRGCAWSAASNAPWLTITSGSSGEGDGTVRFSILSNPSTSSRQGTLTVAGLTVTVEQDGIELVEITLDGEVSSVQGSCPNLTFRLEGRTVRTSSGTTFRRGPCGALRNGVEVRVRGRLQLDGSVEATQVTFEDDDD
jgi:hypothetical protein